jgi:hypothetical protein
LKRLQRRKYLLAKPNATINKAKWDSSIITTNQGILRRRHNAVVHSVPRLSLRYPLSGVADKCRLLSVNERAEADDNVQKRVGTTAAIKTTPTLSGERSQTACK